MKATLRKIYRQIAPQNIADQKYCKLRFLEAYKPTRKPWMVFGAALLLFQAGGDLIPRTLMKMQTTGHLL
jgi:hypothetical protein